MRQRGHVVTGGGACDTGERRSHGSSFRRLPRCHGSGRRGASRATAAAPGERESPERQERRERPSEAGQALPGRTARPQARRAVEADPQGGLGRAAGRLWPHPQWRTRPHRARARVAGHPASPRRQGIRAFTPWRIRVATTCCRERRVATLASSGRATRCEQGQRRTWVPGAGVIGGRRLPGRCAGRRRSPGVLTPGRGAADRTGRNPAGRSERIPGAVRSRHEPSMGAGSALTCC